LLELGKQSGNGKPESGTPQFPAAGLIDPEKSVEDQLEMFRRDPRSGVLNGHADHAPVRPETETDATPERVAHRVGGKIQ
jgi:hypothetical protein